MNWLKKALGHWSIGAALLIAGIGLFAIEVYEVTRPGWTRGQPAAWEDAYEPAGMLVLLGFILLTSRRMFIR
jgi:hypothetical protein